MKKFSSFLCLTITTLLLNGCEGNFFDQIKQWSHEQGARQEQKNINHYIEQANQGDVHAEHMLVDYYMYGTQFLPSNPTQGVYWLKQAASHNDASAMTALGITYYAGIGVQKDKTEAEQWYKKAAEQGNTDAEFWLLHIALGNKQTPTEAHNKLRQIEKIAENGNKNALRWLGGVYSQGNTVLKLSQDPEKAIYYYRKGAKLGDPLAHLALAALYSQNPETKAEAENEYSVAIHSPAFQEFIYLLAIAHQNLTTQEKSITKAYAYVLLLDKTHPMGWLRDRLPQTIATFENTLTPEQKEKAQDLLEKLEDPKTAYKVVERKPFLEVNFTNSGF